jgi:hypothetical protein
MDNFQENVNRKFVSMSENITQILDEPNNEITVDEILKAVHFGNFPLAKMKLNNLWSGFNKTGTDFFSISFDIRSADALLPFLSE